MQTGTFTLSLWTRDPERARLAGRLGVQRIGLDLEVLGKAQRQQGLDTWISPHTLADLAPIAAQRGPAQLFVRCNGLHDGSRAEVEALLQGGVQALILPNFVSAGEVEAFLRLVDGRAQVVPLFERARALAAVGDVVALGVQEAHVGLNDLSIDFGLRNRLVLLAMPAMAAFAERARRLGLRFGLGGLGRADDASLPVPSDLVYAQHARLGSSGALLARSFWRPGADEPTLAADLQALHRRIEHWRHASAAELEASRLQLLGYEKVPT